MKRRGHDMVGPNEHRVATPSSQNFNIRTTGDDFWCSNEHTFNRFRTTHGWCEVYSVNGRGDLPTIGIALDSYVQGAKTRLPMGQDFASQDDDSSTGGENGHPLRNSARKRFEEIVVM
jgi:hypothetical protein